MLKNIQKITVVLMIALLAVSLAACGGEKPETTAATTQPSTTQTAAPSTTTAPAGTTLPQNVHTTAAPTVPATTVQSVTAAPTVPATTAQSVAAAPTVPATTAQSVTAAPTVPAATAAPTTAAPAVPVTTVPPATAAPTVLATAVPTTTAAPTVPVTTVPPTTAAPTVPVTTVPSTTAAPAANVFFNDQNNIITAGAVTITPRYVRYENGQIVAECFVNNGTQQTVTAFQVTRLAFGDSNQQMICDATFPDVVNTVIAPNSSIVHTFRFPAGTVVNPNAQLSSLRCINNVNYRVV